jgi:hypothetical protein
MRQLTRQQLSIERVKVGDQRFLSVVSRGKESSRLTHFDNSLRSTSELSENAGKGVRMGLSKHGIIEPRRAWREVVSFATGHVYHSAYGRRKERPAGGHPLNKRDGGSFVAGSLDNNIAIRHERGNVMLPAMPNQLRRKKGQGGFNQVPVGTIARNMKLELVVALPDRGRGLEQESNILDLHEPAEPAHADRTARRWQLELKEGSEVKPERYQTKLGPWSDTQFVRQLR